MAVSILKRIRIKWHYYFCYPILHKCKCRLEGIPEIHCPERLRLGTNVTINDNVFLQCHGGITVGNNVTISRGVQCLTYSLSTDNYYKNKLEGKEMHIHKPIEIGNGVWLCANVIVTMGVSIAPYSVIGAGSVVTKSLDIPNALYGGIPARFIKFLDNQDRH